MNVPPDSGVVYASCTKPGHDVLEAFLENGVPVTEIVTITPETAEKHGVAKYADFSEIADRHDIPVYNPTTYAMKEQADFDHFESLSADLLVVNGWQRLVPGPILETFPAGALGNHGSAFGLPKGRGRSPLNWSLIQDYERFLLSVIKLDPGADSGDVAATRKFDMTRFDDIETIYYKVTMLLKDMLLETVEAALNGEATYESQPDREVTFYPKRTPEDGDINWGNSTKDVYNLIRAVTDPYPGAFTFHEGTKVMVWEAIPFSYDIARDAEEGTIVDVFWTGDFVVATAEGTLLVTDWEADGWEPEAGMRFEVPDDNDRVDGPEHEHNLSSSGSSDE